MTDKQPEALLYADILANKIPSIECLEKAAAELRRLHEENQQWQEKCNTYIQIHDAVVKDNDRLYALNAELVEALKYMMEWQVKNVNKWHNSAYDNAIEALAKAEGEE